MTIYTGATASDGDQDCTGDGDVGDYIAVSEADCVWRVTDCDPNVKDLRWGNFKAPGWLYYDRHAGYDLACPENTSVQAVAAGTVYYSGSDLYLVHTDGYKTYYRHLNSRIVGPGVSVHPGQKVATSGSAGTGAHLHFEMQNGLLSPIDPYDFWAGGDPIPMGYRDQSHMVHGPFSLDYSQIRQKWFDLDGEPGSPLGDDYAGAVVGQDIDRTTLLERIQSFEHGIIVYDSSSGTYYYPYTETYLPDIRANESTSGWNSTINVRNNHMSSSATVSISLYTEDGRVLDSRTYVGLAPRATWTFSVYDALTQFLNQSYYQGVFQGAAIVYANQDISVAVRTLNLDSQESLAYSGTPSSSVLGFQASNPVLFPNYLRGWGPNPPYYTGNWHSYLNILNTGSVPTTIKVRFHGWDGTTGNVDTTDVPPNGSIQIEPPDGAATTGGVRVVSEDPPQPLAATITHYFALNPRRGAEAALSVGARTLHLPSVFKGYPPPDGHWQCSINLFNTENNPTGSCTIHFYNPEDGSEYATAPCSVGPTGSQTIGLAGLGQIADGWWGSAVVAADKMLVAAVFQENVTNNDWQSYNGFKGGVSVLSLPWLQHGSESWNGSLTVMNVGCSSTNVTAYFCDGSGLQLGTSPADDLDLYETYVFGVANPSTRSALVTTSPSCPIVAIVSEMNTSISDGGVSYNAVD